MAQSDNFDSGVLDPAWKRSHFSPALVNLSFPDTATGKGLRIQASPVPDQAPAAAMFYREQVYSNFYMAVDIANWPGTDKNQAIVLMARATLSANPATTTGIIMNYDASQYGENATDRRQGQLQINMVTNDPPFATKTLAVAEVTFEPGRAYRLVFKGVGSQYTAQAYDLYDLTQPLVTIHADDDIQGPEGGAPIFEGGFKSGVSGVLSFSRQGNVGTTDITIDNYFAAATDPNAELSPGIAHPVAGTPVVSHRVPANRFQNFFNPTNSISFTATTHSTNLINAAATKFRLNGVDVSSHLTLPNNDDTIDAVLRNTALTPNMVYSAQIEVEDVSGTKKSTNTFWFDTYSDAYVASPPVKTIEAEDYNYSGGQFQEVDPIPVSGMATNGAAVNGGGIGYWEQDGLEEVDYHDARTGPEGTWANEYRSFDAIGLSAGMFPEIEDVNETSAEPIRRSDNVRAKYASSNLLEYVVHRTEPGEWMNYTRDFSGSNYTVYLRVASFGATDVELHRVSGDVTQPDQSTTKLGTFHVPNMFTRYNYRYIPLVTDAGTPAVVNIPGRQTLRLQMAGTAGQDARKIALNYLMFVPQVPTAEFEVESSETPTGGFALDSTAVFAWGAGRFDIPVSGRMRFFRVRSSTPMRLTQPVVLRNTMSFEVRPAP